MLNRKNGVPLPDQLKEELLSRIKNGYYKPGERIDTVRKLAAEFGVSSLTVQRACRLLEEENCIISMPQSGMFVPEDFFERAGNPRKMVFVFPETEISSRVLDMENWGLNSELYRGFLAGSQKYPVQLDLLHISQDSSFREKFRQIERIRDKYDGAVFVGNQNRDVQLELAESGKFRVFHIADQPQKVPAPLTPVCYDHEKALAMVMDSALGSGLKKWAVLTLRSSSEHYLELRHSRFVELCRSSGIGSGRLFDHIFDESDRGQLPDILKQLKGFFIFCNNAYLVRDLYIAAQKNGMIPGQDFRIMAIASGFTFTGLIPALTFVRVPMYEIGYTLMKRICEASRPGFENFRWDPVVPECIAGETAPAPSAPNCTVEIREKDKHSRGEKAS